MKIWTKGKRLAAALLAVVLILSIVPSGVIPVHSEESEPVDYGQYIGYFAEVGIEDFQGLTISSDPETAVSEQLYATDLSASIVLQIVDYTLVGSSVWYMVSAAPGYTLPQKLATHPWIFQRDISIPSSKDALTLKKPAFSNANTSVISDNGIVVSSDAVKFTALSVQQRASSLTTSNIVDTVAYNIDLETTSGDYSGYATVTIPIPDGWDRSKIFGFVEERDDSVSMIPGTVNNDGTFSFTVPHFSVVGIAQVADVRQLESMIITFGKIQQKNTVTLPGVIGTAGRYTSDDGAVEYVISHEAGTDSDGSTTYTTHITFKGLYVTDGVVIEIGNCAYTVKVIPGSAEIEKLLVAGDAASTTLHPLYDLGITGPYTATYDMEGDCIEFGDASGTITISDTFLSGTATTATATVEATVRPSAGGDPVATVTYTVMVCREEVDDVKMLYVPEGRTVTISKYTGTVITEGLLDTDLATVEAITDANEDVTGIEITGKVKNSETYFIADTGTEKILFIVYVEPENSAQSKSHLIWFRVDSNPNCTIYYAINGGTLHRVEAGVTSQVVLIGLDNNTEQEFPDGYNIMIFSAPDAGYATSKMYIAKSAGEYYCLSNGTRYDGSDSSAWPLNNADAVDGDTSYKTGHGLSSPLRYGNMTVTEMRDLFARALALGCDGVANITRTDYDDKAVFNSNFVAEKLPELKKTIVKVVREGEEIHNAANPYDPETHFLKVGDIITYQFEVEIHSQFITYDFTITDPYLTKNGSTLSIDGLTIGGTAVTLSTEEIDENSAANTVVSHSTTSVSLEFAKVTQTVSFTVDYKLNEADIKSYAGGRFENVAELAYTYASDVAVGKNTVKTDAYATCKVDGIVTWEDCFGNILAVQTVPTNTQVKHPTTLPNYTPYYSFDGWYIDNVKLEGSTYTTDDTGRSVTIVAKYIPAEYTITYDLGDGVIWPAGATVSYTFDDVVDIPMPQMPGYEFIGWEVTSTDGTEENWPEKIDCSGEYVITKVYGNVTLKPRWSRTTLKIQVTGWNELDEGQTFLFTVTDGNGMSLDVVVAGNGYVIIEGLDSNTQYTITQKLDWSWRYGLESISCEDNMHMDISGSSATVTVVDDEENTVTFTQDRVKGQWLDGNGDNFSSQN